MCARVERHRRDRPREWAVVETAGGPPLSALVRDARADECIVIEALGTWLAALMLAEDVREDVLERHGAELAAAIAAASADVIVIAEEAGWGVVPATPLGRLFRDVLGRLTRQLAAGADRVELVVAGFALDLRRAGVRVDDV
jgi:adenosylcobinamide kinase/adenosylcobinamide-phosphate guanylyltransferase